MDLGDIVVGALVAVLGLIGLFLASRALDLEIYIFGLALFGFAAVFVWGLVLQAIRRGEATRSEGGFHG